MAINKFYFQLDKNRYSTKEGSDFLFETYYITEYISRLIRKERFVYEKANKVLIYLGSEVSDIDCSEMFKCVYVNLNDEYLPPSSHSDSERVEWVLDKLRKSGMLLDNYIPKFSESMNRSLREFVGDLCRNVWVFHSKRVKPLGKVQLECELNRDNFILYFVVRGNETELFRKEILKTLPDSLCYHHKFNKLKVENGIILVPDRSNIKPGCLFSISINSLVHNTETNAPNN